MLYRHKDSELHTPGYMTRRARLRIMSRSHSKFYRKSFMCSHLSKSYEVKTTGKFQPKRGIYEVSFGIHSKMGGYTTLMSDILELGEIS
jgi:hypothetical protein